MIIFMFNADCILSTRRLHSLFGPVGHQLLPLELLLGHLLLLRFAGALLEGFLLLDQAQLDVARRGHVGVNPTVSSVSPAPHLGCPVDLNVVHDQVVGVQTLVFGVGLGILQQMQQELGALLGPTTLGSLVSLGLGVTADTAHVTAEGDDLLLCDDVLQVLDGTVKWHLLDGLSRLACVLKSINN